MKAETCLWRHPDPSATHMGQFKSAIETKYGVCLPDYAALHRWSVDERQQFWAEIWSLARIKASRSYSCVVDEAQGMHKARWFGGSSFNVAENLLRETSDRMAIIAADEAGNVRELTFQQLYEEVSRVVQALRNAQVKKGDRVAAVVTNTPEAIIVMLATAAIGAVFSSCSPDFGLDALNERFGQIEPVILFSCSCYQYQGRHYDCSNTVLSLAKSIPQIRQIVWLDVSGTSVRAAGGVRFTDFCAAHTPQPIDFEQYGTDHPVYILYSSGTTGKPKCIVHGGGVFLQLFKEHRLHCDFCSSDVLLYFTTCGWMMWNWQLHALALGVQLLLYDGSPSYPGKGHLWDIARRFGATVLGVSPKYLGNCEEQKVTPSVPPTLRMILTSGAPLLEAHFDYVYRHLPWVQLAPISGGTDLLSCFILANPLLPVIRGRMQARGLGMDVLALNERGEALVARQGELVCRAPFPSQPLSFWGDSDGSKYYTTYFDVYPGVWCHGDYLTIYEDGSAVIWGRSDATLNRGGVRIGTAEIYNVLERLEYIEDSLITAVQTSGDEELVLFVVMSAGAELTKKRSADIKQHIKNSCSPRHVPRFLFQAAEIPYTFNGKRMELAVKKAINGQRINNLNAIVNPNCLGAFSELAKRHLSSV